MRNFEENSAVWKDCGGLKEAGNKAEIKGGVESKGWDVNDDYADGDDDDEDAKIKVIVIFIIIIIITVVVDWNETGFGSTVQCIIEDK